MVNCFRTPTSSLSYWTPATIFYNIQIALVSAVISCIFIVLPPPTTVINQNFSFPETEIMNEWISFLMMVVAHLYHFSTTFTSSFFTFKAVNLLQNKKSFFFVFSIFMANGKMLFVECAKRSLNDKQSSNEKK